MTSSYQDQLDVLIGQRVLHGERFSYVRITHDVKILVRPVYLEEQSLPFEDHFVWAYQIRAENLRQDPVQLMSRYWRITDASGRVIEVRGSGVVGEQPIIQPGSHFEYTSGTPLAAPSGIMVGCFEMKDLLTGESFDVDVPTFSLDSPFQKISLN